MPPQFTESSLAYSQEEGTNIHFFELLISVICFLNNFGTLIPKILVIFSKNDFQGFYLKGLWRHNFLIWA